MAVAAEALLKLRAVFDGDGFDKAARALGGVERTAAQTKRSFKNVFDSSAWQGAAVAATGIGAGLVYSAKKAIELESQMVQVRKVVDFESPNGLRKLQDDLVGLSTRIPYTAKELAELAAAAGMAGYAEKDILRFVEAAAKMGTAFNMSAKDAGDAMVAFQAAMGLSLDEAIKLGDAINHLSDNLAGVVEPEALVEVTKRVGAIGVAAGLSAKDVAALGAAFLAPGTNAEVAATGLKNFLKALTQGEAGSKSFRAAMDRLMGMPNAAQWVAKQMQIDPRGTIMKVLDQLRKIPKEFQAGLISDIFGEESKAAIQPLLTNTKLLSDAFGLVGDDAKFAGSMTNEFNNQLNSSEVQLKLFKNNIDAIAIALGQALLPGINAVLMALRPFISALLFATQKVPGLSTAIVALGVAFAGIVISAPFIAGLLTIASAARGLWGSATAARGLGSALSTVLRGGTGGSGFFAGLVNAAKALPGLVMGALRGLPGMVAGLFRGLGGAMGLGNITRGLQTFFTTLRGFTPTMVMKGGQWVVPWTVRLATALRGILPVLALVGRTLLGVFTGPVGWVTLLIGAGVALFTFRNQIGQFVASVGPALAGVFAPLRNLAGGLMTAISTSLANLGTMLAPVWAGIATAFRTYVITPIQQVWNFLVVWIGQTIAAYAIVWWQGVVQGFNLYVVQPIQMAWGYLLQALALAVQGLATVWAGISQAFNTYVVLPVQTAWNGLVAFFGQGVAYLRGILSQVWAGVSAAFVQWVVQPITQAWNQLVGLFNATTGPLRTALSSAWQGVAENFNQYVVQPVSSLWNGLATFVGNAAGGMVRAFQGAWQGVAGAVMNGVITPLQNMFNGLASRIRTLFDGLLVWARGIGNFIVDRVNPVRQMAGMQPLQRFAKGGYVNGPTLGLIGEGRDPREYIIPERKMAGAAMNYLSGKRGASVLSGVPRFAQGGFVQGGRTFNFKGGSGAYMEINGRRISLDNLEDANKEFARIADANTLEMEKAAAKSQGLSLSAYKKQQKRVQSLFFGGAETPYYKRLFGSGGGMNSIIRAGASLYPDSNSREMSGMRKRASDNALMRRSMNARVRTSRLLSRVSLNAILTGTTGNTGGYFGSNSRRQFGSNPIRRTLVTQAKGRNRSEIAKMQMMLDRARTENQRIMQMDDFYFQLYMDSKAQRGAQAFARGGYVNKPTLGLIGEAGDNEYVIPERRMAASAMAFLSGARGMDVVNPPRFANGGVVGSSVSNRSGNINALLERTGAIGGQTVVVQEPQVNATIQVQTGDVLQFEGQQYVTLSDYQRGLKQVQSETMGLLRTAQGRRATGR